MVDLDLVLFNIAVFIGGLFILERSADKFIEHTTKLASHLGIPPTLIALLTAGAEWEELVVVIASISQNNTPLALGNILGSTIANILGAFSLGLIFSPGSVAFDRSAKIYTAISLALTTLFVPFLLFANIRGRVGGGLLIAAFIVYVSSIAWAIYKGIVSPPEVEDSDDGSSNDDSDSESDLGASSGESVPLRNRAPRHSHEHSRFLSRSSSTTSIQDPDPDIEQGKKNSSTEVDRILGNAKPQVSKKPQRSHVFHLTISVIMLSLSGYLLSHSITTVAEYFAVSSTVVGATILSFATTLPEKVVAVMGGRCQQPGIVVANTVGSNIFLLTLCSGVLFMFGDLSALMENATNFEIVCMWGSSLLLFGIVMYGGRRWMGWALLAMYVMFIICEFLLKRD